MKRMSQQAVVCFLFCAGFYLLSAGDAMALSITDLFVTPDFSCVGGSPVGRINTTANCEMIYDYEQVLQEGRIFGYFLCRYEQILNDLLSMTYCGVVDYLKPAIMAGMTLLIALAGASFLMGVTTFNAKELMTLAFKYSLVLAFATQAEYMIGLGYNLFMTGSKEGIVYVLDYLFDSSYSFVNAEGETVTIAINTASDVYHIFDATLSGVIISSATGEADPSAACENSLLLMIFVVAAALPPLAIIAIYFVVKVVWMMLRALFGYCQGMLGITFLVMLAPIYVSFALFRATRPMFDKWVQYLISFSFQMVIVFGFLGFMFNALSKTSESMEDYTALIRPLQGEQSLRPSVFTAIDTCGICEMEFQGTRNTPVCKTPERVLPLTSMISDTEFMKFASYKIFALVVLIMIFDMLLTFVPTMAAYLAGSKHAARLGGGEMNAGGAFQDNVAIPGSQALNEMANSAATEFARSGSTPGGIVNGFVGAFAGSDGRGGIMGDRGVVDYMIRSVGNPQDPFRTLPESSSADNAFDALFALGGAGAAMQAFGGRLGTPQASAPPASGPSSPSGASAPSAPADPDGPGTPAPAPASPSAARTQAEISQQLAAAAGRLSATSGDRLADWIAGRAQQDAGRADEMIAAVSNALSNSNTAEDVTAALSALGLPDDIVRDVASDYAQ